MGGMMNDESNGGLKIVVGTIGTRGDVQPFIALALGLKAAGHKVTLLTNEDHVSMARDLGVECEGCFANFADFMESDATMRQAMAAGNLRLFFKSLGGFMDRVAPDNYAKWIESVRRIEPDLYVEGSLNEFYGNVLKYEMHVPVVPLKLQWCSPVQPHRVVGLRTVLPCGLNRLLSKLLLAGLHHSMDALDRVHVDHGFASVRKYFPLSEMIRDYHDPPLEPGMLVATPDIFLKTLDPEYPASIHPIGTLAIKGQMDLACDGFGDAGERAELLRFFELDDAPCYFGFGSMICKDATYMTTLILKIAKLLDKRCVVTRGWAKLDAGLLESQDLRDYASGRVLFVDKAPHDWLFPKCACVCHHGGAGTTAAAARAGVPQCITPVFVDQFDSAYIVNQLKVGRGFDECPLSKLTAERIASAIDAITQDPAFKDNARALQTRLFDAPDASTVAADIIQDFWSKHVRTGDYDISVRARCKMPPKNDDLHANKDGAK